MADCGTVAGYHAHKRRSEETCADCRAAMAEDKRQQRMEARQRAAEDFREALELEPDVEDDVDELADAKENLRILRAEMKVNKSGRERAVLSKQRMDLVRRIKELEAERNKSKGVLGGFEDELAEVLRPDFTGRTGT